VRERDAMASSPAGAPKEYRGRGLINVTERRSPPPWSVEAIGAAYVVKDGV